MHYYKTIFLIALIPMSSSALYGMVSPLLDYSLYYASPEKLSILLAQKTNPNVMDKWGSTPLNCAIDTGNNNAVTSLLNAGANPNQEIGIHDDKSTPLTAAIWRGETKIVITLLEFGADPNLRTTPIFPIYPIMIAIDAAQNNKKRVKDCPLIVGLLLKFGVNPLLPQKIGLDVFICMKEIFESNMNSWKPKNVEAYKKVCRALVRYKILNETLIRNFCLPKEIAAYILQLVDYGLDDKGESTT